MRHMKGIDILELDPEKLRTGFLEKNRASLQDDKGSENKPFMKILIDFHSLSLNDRIIEDLKEFYKENKSYIAAVAACGVGNGVRKVILQSSGIPFLYAEDTELGKKMLDDNEEELLI